MKLKQQLFLIALLIMSVTNAIGQVSFDSPEELEKAASEFFDSKNYEKAKPLYSQLLSLNALNANYNYRFGVCVLYTESDPLKPLPYIEGGANTDGVNPEAYFFLGKAYQLNYRFDEAITYFEKAKKSSFKSDGVDLERSIQECRNGKLLYNEAIAFAPAQDKEVLEAEFYRPYDFRKLKGKVIPMPPNFKTKYDEKNLKGTFVYTPTNSQSLFFASYGDDGSDAKDLYRVNRLPNGEYALPQRLPNTINTKYDEDFAFFDDESQTLYFASKGHNTMGGYDVFRSVYDADKNEWTPPINLQFPINSPYDDFLYVSDPSGKVAFFTSKRETELGKIRVFKTLLYDPEQVELSIVEGTFEDNTDSIYNYMLATVFDPKTNQVIGKYRSNKETGKYVLILPPQNDYSMDVGPREAAGFKFDLDVPQHEPTKPLQQNLTYDSQSGDGTVTMTNFFDAAGNPDSVAVAMNRSKEEVEAAMVEMPDPAEILASRKAEREEKQRQEQAKLEELALLEKAKFAAEKAKQDSLIAAKQAALEAEAARLKAESERKDSIAQAEAEAAQLAMERETAIADSIAKAEAAELEKQLAAQREQFVADSIAKAEELALQLQADREKFVSDSISKAEAESARLAAEREQAFADSIAKAEAAELEKQLAAEREQFIADSIAKAEELEETKALALQDSVVETDVAVADSEEASFEEILQEMQEKEAEILAEEGTGQTTEKSDTSIETGTAELAEQTKDSLESKEVIAEADLYLQTIADLEKQKEKQQAEVTAENERAAKEKAEKRQKEIAIRDSLAGLENTDLAMVVDSSQQSNETVTTVGEKDLEQESLALKSNADPNEYLKALAEMEAKMAEDAAKNSKVYELQDLNPDKDSEKDAALEAKVAKDREALRAHQQIAAKKEAALKERMQRDKDVVKGMLDEEADEIAAIESDLLEEVDVQKQRQLEELEGAEKSITVEERELSDASDLNTEPDVSDEVEGEVDEIEEVAIEHTGDIKTESEPNIPEEESLIAEADEILNELSTEDSPAELVSIDSSKTVTDDNSNTETIPQEETADLVAEADQAVEELLELKQIESSSSEVAKESKTSNDTLAIIEPVADTETTEDIVTGEDKSEIQETETVAEMSIGRIPFLTPALRDYGKRKADFSNVQDKSIKRMVQRMRSEDIGRLAVLKNMKNQWVDAGKTQESLQEIKSNTRNQDVLEFVANQPSREEKVRQPFNRNDLKEREGVYYKLDFELVSDGVSEKVQEAMNPEQLMSFFMPEFELDSGYFTTLADVRSEKRYYEERGFRSVEIDAYLNGERIPLSDVNSIPFVD